MNKPTLSITILAATCSVSTPLIADSRNGLEEVVVRGQKIERSLQDTKESVALITAESIESRGLIDLRDVLDQTAGIAGSGASFRIRGIDSGDIGTLRSELASLYVDGVALSGWVKSEGPQQMWDVEQVEIFRGPQSTNLGRNSLAGAIVVTTQSPRYENESRIRAGLGNYGTRELSGMANVSLVDGVSAIRVTADRRETDGFVTNETRNEDDYAFIERQNIRAKWLLEPSDNLRLLTSLQYVENDYGDNSQAFEASGYDREERIALADVRGEYPLEAFLGSVRIDYEINTDWSLKSITAAMDGRRTRTDDFDNSAANGGFVYREGDDNNFSQELRLDYGGEALRGSSGIYASRVNADNINASTVILRLRDYGAGDLIDLGIYPELYDLSTGGDTAIETTNYALFSEWDMDMGPQWLLSFGARYDRESQDVKFQATGGSSVTLPDPADWAAFGLDGIIVFFNSQLEALSTTGPLFQPQTDFDAFLPHVGLTYDWKEDVSTSIFVRRGYRAGGTEITGLNNVNEYDPEFLTNYELAIRTRVLDGRAFFNTNIYYADWKDQQVNVPEIPGSETFRKIENAGRSKIYGLETEFNIQFNDSLNLFATAGYSHTEYDEFVASSGEDLSGNSFKFAPELTGAIGMHYRFGNGFYANATLSYEGESYTDDANTVELDSRVLANLHSGYTRDAWKIEAYATNLTDEQYPTNIFGLEDVNGDRQWGRMGAPRQYGLRVDYRL